MLCDVSFRADMIGSLLLAEKRMMFACWIPVLPANSSGKFELALSEFLDEMRVQGYTPIPSRVTGRELGVLECQPPKGIEDMWFIKASSVCQMVQIHHLHVGQHLIEAVFDYSTTAPMQFDRSDGFVLTTAPTH